MKRRFRKRLISLAMIPVLLGSMGWTAAALSPEKISAPSALLMEAETGRVLFEKNAHEKRPCASITKVMTLLLAMEALDEGKIKLEDEVAASAHAASMGGSDIWLKEGEVMSVDDLLKATVIMSANDAAVVLAEYIAGSESDFVAQMNQKAAELGMKDTTFKNCNGLDEDGHLTSAYDVALMSRALISHEKIFDYTQVWMDSVRGGETQLVNTNKLLKTYNGITGLKTGTTGKAGSCITATATRDGLSLISVVLGCSNTKDRFDSAAKLLDYGFANCESAQLEIPALQQLAVTNGMESLVGVEAKSEGKVSVLVPKGKEEQVKVSVSMPESVRAPVEKGQKLGEVLYQLEDDTLGKVSITATEAVEAIDWQKCFVKLLESLLCFI